MVDNASRLLLMSAFVAHCSSSMSWLRSLRNAIEREGLFLVKVNVVTKCGHSLHKLSMSIKASIGVEANVTSRSNTGRCDHSWASHIVNNFESLASRLIFLKDSWTERTTIAPQSADKLVKKPASGFVCAYRSPVSWHKTEDLSAYMADAYNTTWDQAKRANAQGNHATFKAAIRPLGAWWRSLQIAELDTSSRRFVPVCYGGGFATTADAIRRVPLPAWNRVVQSLERGENIEEGHYMERSWAALLTAPLQLKEDRALACATANAPSRSERFFRGGIGPCHCADVAACLTSNETATALDSETSEEEIIITPALLPTSSNYSDGHSRCLFPLETESMTRPCRHHVPDALLSQRAQLLFCCGIFIP